MYLPSFLRARPREDRNAHPDSLLVETARKARGPEHRTPEYLESCMPKSTRIAVLHGEGVEQRLEPLTSETPKPPNPSG